MARERVGHTGLNNTLKKMNKHETGDYEFCGQEETFERVTLECAEYRQILTLQKNRDAGTHKGTQGDIWVFKSKWCLCENIDV